MSGSQIAVLVVGAALVVDLIIRVIALAVVPKNRRPSSAMAWLLAIYLIPYLGIALFLLIGSNKLPKKRRDKQAAVDEFIVETTENEGLPPLPEEPAWFAEIAKLNRKLGAMPVLSGNSARLTGSYNDSLADMADAIDNAHSFVHCEFYIMSKDAATKDFFAALERAVQRGVMVRVLLDHIASIRTPTHRETARELTRIGADWHYMLPIRPLRGQWQRPDLRNHRKLLVLDNRVAYMGSQNVIDRSYNTRGNIRRGLQWQDLMTAVTGPIVREVNSIFLTDWYSETDEVLSPEESGDLAEVSTTGSLDCQLVPSGPGFEGENNLQLFLSLFYYAQRRVSITSPYFVPDESMLLAITAATHRGVEVELFVSEIGDQAGVFHAQRSYYQQLLKAGVRIWRYPGPYILHAKHLTIDEDVAVIGSSNMDIRSFDLDLEISLLVRGSRFNADLRHVENGYREISKELTLEEWEAEPMRRIMLDNVARLTSALQ